MCNFCDNIKDMEWYKEHDFYIDNVIIQTGPTSFGLWMKCENCSGNGGIIKIKFCPICGTDLIYKKLEDNLKPKYEFDF